MTVLFCDLAGSTALGERLDAEPLRQVMQRYYDAMREPVERHGGRVEKFIGDAVVAAFGLPAAHEDDALRAVRAAVEMRDGLERLNKELERDYGVTLAIRQGINSGEVLASGDEALGDPINVAARLQQAAGRGEILLGEPVRRLVRDAVVLDPVAPVAAKGKAEPLVAWRLRGIVPGAEAIARRLDSPMVGRDRELALLRDAFDRAAGERECHLFTVLGTAGVGKSRLVRELESLVAGEATVLRGRCLPYGQGITFWPLRDIVSVAAGITSADAPEEAEARIASWVGDDHDGAIIARTVTAVAGLAEASLPGEEAAWAVRRFFETLAARVPLVVVFEDIHWAEPAMLDLIDHVAELARDAPMLLVCPSRPELLDTRPSWGGGKRNATAITLEPLSEADSERIIANLLGEIPMPAEVARRIAEAAGGTPLFVEEMIAMLIDDGLLRREDGHWVAAGDLSAIAVPATIQTLLAARLDRLPREERIVLERAAVVGREHWRAAVADLMPDDERDGMTRVLASLVRKDLLRPERSSLAGHEAYRCRHILILDAAYQGLPKQERAAMHERFADWLEREAPDADDIPAYHLEQAVRYLAELGPAGERAPALAARAGAKLAAAGRRAVARGDAGAANLLTRAVAMLEPETAARGAAQLDRALALAFGATYEEQLEALVDAEAIGHARGDRALSVRAALLRRLIDLVVRPLETDVQSVLDAAHAAIAEFDGTGEHAVLSTAWEAAGQAHNFVGRYGPSCAAAAAAADHATQAGDERSAIALLGRQAWLMVIGPTPLGEVDAWMETLRPRWLQSRYGEAAYWRTKAMVLTLTGRIGEAREACRRGRRVAEDLGDAHLLERLAFVEGPLELSDGNPVAAEQAVRPVTDWQLSIGDRSYYSTLITFVAEAVFQQGRFAEALALTEAADAAASPEDMATQVSVRSLRAKLLAETGDLDVAERLAREALAMARRTDVVLWMWQAFQSLAVVLRAAGRREEAIAAAAEGIRIVEAKGATVHVDALRAIVASF